MTELREAPWPVVPECHSRHAPGHTCPQHDDPHAHLWVSWPGAPRRITGGTGVPVRCAFCGGRKCDRGGCDRLRHDGHTHWQDDTTHDPDWHTRTGTCPSCGMTDGRHVATCRTPEAIAWQDETARTERLLLTYPELRGEAFARAVAFRPETPAAYPSGQPYRVDEQGRTPWDPTRYGPPNRHLSRHAADLWATPLHDLREALTDLARATAHVLYDATLGRRTRG